VCVAKMETRIASRLARIAVSEVDSLSREESYLYLGVDRTKPVRVQAQIKDAQISEPNLWPSSRL
jgi:hypothetical protein